MVDESSSPSSRASVPHICSVIRRSENGPVLRRFWGFRTTWEVLRRFREILERLERFQKIWEVLWRFERFCDGFDTIWRCFETIVMFFWFHTRSKLHLAEFNRSTRDCWSYCSIRTAWMSIAAPAAIWWAVKITICVQRFDLPFEFVFISTLLWVSIFTTRCRHSPFLALFSSSDVDCLKTHVVYLFRTNSLTF